MTAPLLVLVRPRSPDNLVSIAWAMKTFGFHDWVAVISQVHFTHMQQVVQMRFTPDEAAMVATLRRVESLDEAVAGREIVVGTTMREFAGKPRMTPRELALYQAHSEASWALVFGAESNGLTGDDVKSCNALSFIPTHPDQPSVNLSQAVVLYAYEMHAAKTSAATLVDVRELRALRETIAHSVRERGISRRTADELVAPLVRAELTREERALHEEAWSA